MLFVSNAFSLSMFDCNLSSPKFKELSLSEAKTLLTNSNFVSAVGHNDTATVLSSLLNVYLPVNRVNVFCNNGDSVLVFQLQGGRLAEGCTTLPEGATFKFILVTF